MSAMAQLDMDRQELNEVAMAAGMSVVEAIERGEDDLETVYTEAMFAALTERGWVAPTKAEVAIRKLKPSLGSVDAVNGAAIENAIALIGGKA